MKEMPQKKDPKATARVGSSFDDFLAEEGILETCESQALAELNQEIGRRLSSLDHGEHVEPSAARARLLRKSRERTKQG
jgi:hypothetical protein